MKRMAALISCILFLVLSACQMPLVGTPTPIIPSPTSIPPTFTPPPPAPTPTHTATVTLTPTETPFAPFYAVTASENVNLRVNPGRLFPVSRVLPQGTRLLVSGRTPGGEWMWVQTQEGVNGWVFAILLRSEENLRNAPVIVPPSVQILRGRVLDVNGVPMQGIGFSVFQGSGQNAPTDHVLTDPYGEFFSFLPLNASGTWTVGHDSIACVSNVWKGDDCAQYKDGYTGLVEPESVNVTLPHSEYLLFTWK